MSLLVAISVPVVVCRVLSIVGKDVVCFEQSVGTDKEQVCKIGGHTGMFEMEITDKDQLGKYRVGDVHSLTMSNH